VGCRSSPGRKVGRCWCWRRSTSCSTRSTLPLPLHPLEGRHATDAPLTTWWADSPPCSVLLCYSMTTWSM
jgi:hypothetical protein